MIVDSVFKSRTSNYAVNIATIEGVYEPIEAEGLSPNIELVESSLSSEVASTKLYFGDTSYVTLM
jgi:hypothetical protein